MSKLALGTAQFGQPYGVANVTGQVSAHVVAQILERAREAGLDTLDTAISYGVSESRLGEAGVRRWRVISKLPPVPEGATGIDEWAEMQLHGSLERLRLSELEALLIHDALELLRPHGSDLVAVLDTLKRRGLIRAAGVSVYAPTDLERVLAVWRPDIVQAPCNVFDRRLTRSGWLRELSQRKIRVHIRSVFLQGLLLMDRASRPPWFERWAGLLDRWGKWCGENQVSALQAALGFVQALPDVERVIVGVDTCGQLEEILAAERVVLPAPEDLASEDPDLIEPRRWKLK